MRLSFKNRQKFDCDLTTGLTDKDILEIALSSGDILPVCSLCAHHIKVGQTWKMLNVENEDLKRLNSYPYVKLSYCEKCAQIVITAKSGASDAVDQITVMSRHLQRQSRYAHLASYMKNEFMNRGLLIPKRKLILLVFGFIMSLIS